MDVLEWIRSNVSCSCVFRTCHGNFDQQSEKRLTNGGNGRGACLMSRCRVCCCLFLWPLIPAEKLLTRSTLDLSQVMSNTTTAEHRNRTTNNTSLSGAADMFWHQYTDCQRNEICHELLSWEFLTEKKRLSQGGQSLTRDKKGFLFPN